MPSSSRFVYIIQKIVDQLFDISEFVRFFLFSEVSMISLALLIIIAYQGSTVGPAVVEAVRLCPCHFNLGMIYKEIGMDEKAAKHLGKAHNLDPARF